jgi:outer membrane lipoprotein LolB
MSLRASAHTHVLALTLLLAGCASLQYDPERAAASWSVRQAQLQQLNRFSVQARASASGALSGKLNLIWQQRPQDFSMRLSGPFGVGGMSLAGNEQRVEVRSRDENFVTDDPEAALYQRLGWSLPIAGLRYWILGLPSPASEAQQIQLDASGRVIGMTQDRWTLEYEEYQRVDSLDLPRRLSLSSADLQVRIAIDTWSDLTSSP